RHVHLIFQVAARLRPFLRRSCSAAPAKHAAKDVAKSAAAAGPPAPAACPGAFEHVGKIEAAKIHMLPALAGCARIEAAAKSARSATLGGISFGGCRIDVVGVEAQLVVDLALLGIAQNVVGFGELLELFLRG